MSIAVAIRDWGRDVADGWNRFWFTPTDPATLSVIRILAGAMLLYTHAVWTIGFADFFGPDGWISRDAATLYFTEAPYAWSWFYWTDSLVVLRSIHIASLVVFAMLTVGLWSRVASVLAFLATVAYMHRVPGALFGLDQINAMLAMYLMIGPCGARFSVDRWLARRRTLPAPGATAGLSSSSEGATAGLSSSSKGATAGLSSSAVPSVSANIAIRLMQLHMCVIYLFSGVSKLMGVTWWTGEAMWNAVANYEYQSIDATWLAAVPIITSLLAHATVYWETFYCALIWPRLTRPVMLLLAVPVHLGIAMFMGMITFGLAMLIANAAFLPPRLLVGSRQ